MGPGGRERGLEFLLVSVKSGAVIIPTPTYSVLSSSAWVARAVPEVGVPAGVCLLSRASSRGTSVHTARSPWFARAVELPTLLFVGWRVWLILGVRVRHRPPPHGLACLAASTCCSAPRAQSGEVGNVLAWEEDWGEDSGRGFCPSLCFRLGWQEDPVWTELKLTGR